MELAAVGVAIAVFNQASKIAIFPLVSVTTSFVAEEDATKSLSIDSQEIEIVENGFAADGEKEELLPKVGKALTIFLFVIRRKKCCDNSFFVENMKIHFFNVIYLITVVS